MERVVTQIELLFARGGRRSRGFLRIGEPWVVSDAQARCEIEIDAPGVLELRQAISGGDTFQALLLAIRFLATMLTHYQRKGLEVLDLEGDRWPMEAYFGALALETPRPMSRIRFEPRLGRARPRRRR